MISLSRLDLIVPTAILSTLGLAQMRGSISGLCHAGYQPPILNALRVLHRPDLSSVVRQKEMTKISLGLSNRTAPNLLIYHAFSTSDADALNSYPLTGS
jgi:hypothetical protein